MICRYLSSRGISTLDRKPTLKSCVENRLSCGMRHRLLLAIAVLMSGTAIGQIKNTGVCNNAGIGTAKLSTGAAARIVSVNQDVAGSGGSAVPYCLVKVLVPQAVNIWVGLPMGGKWNGRLQAEGNGGYAGTVSTPTNALADGYVG